ncbi:Oidioi.mRNA.OKI2018_I69.chr1.g594.t1.cds [Oikopleura dioica]|uniref:Hexosyltransferase n=1 Tax=Oikopleura dioica TaxID=34765 RepID=A0ABN7SRL8_OIKDI|nr:Oidioi.mRNA.OKI2018_I69.chr1.g594.t1.cds [Oikopleura dioica]
MRLDVESLSRVVSLIDPAEVSTLCDGKIDAVFFTRNEGDNKETIAMEYYGLKYAEDRIYKDRYPREMPFRDAINRTKVAEYYSSDVKCAQLQFPWSTILDEEISKQTHLKSRQRSDEFKEMIEIIKHTRRPVFIREAAKKFLKINGIEKIAVMHWRYDDNDYIHNKNWRRQMAEDFIMEIRDDYDENLILDEKNLYDDILYGSFQDSYWNLTYKEIMFYTWTEQKAPNVKFVYRGDDDNFLNPLGLMKFFDEHWSQANAEPALWGGIIKENNSLLGQGMKVEEIRKERKADVWPGLKFPPYPAGSGQIINRNALFVLGSQMQRTPITSVDDAFVGICMLYAGFEQGPEGYCVPTESNCSCADCVDFLELENYKNAILDHEMGVTCCSLVQVHSKMLFRGIYRKIIIDEENAEYVSQEVSKDKPVFKLVYGKINSEESGWHILMVQNDTYNPFYAFGETTSKNNCPKKLIGSGPFVGKEASVHCYHMKYDEMTISGL